MSMPDSPSKKKWDKENIVLFAVKLQRKKDQDIIDYLEGKNKRDVVCAAIRYYIENHSDELKGE